MQPCLLLSHDYVPLKIVSVKQAFRLLFNEKVDVVLDYSDKVIKTVSRVFKIPAVIRLLGKVGLRFKVKLSRRNIMVRDQFKCQYCGSSGKSSTLTLDHCIPRSRGGKFSWENLVTACEACNARKGDRTPEEAKMPMAKQPRKLDIFEYLQNLVNTKYRIPEWSNFLS
jgi:5-methylcytosine-specific restriction endonuclease McrA